MNTDRGTPRTPSGYETALNLGAEVDQLRRESAALREQLAEARRRVVEECAKEIPTSWLDPLLTGPSSVIGKLPADEKDVARLLTAIAVRIRALAAPQQSEQESDHV